MGTTKEDLTPKSSKAESLLAIMRGRKRRQSEEPKKVAENFRDTLVSLDESIEKMLIQKQADLKAESGQELKNTKKVELLEKMSLRLEQIVEYSDEYAKL